MKTLAFYSVLSDRGCAFQISSDDSDFVSSMMEGPEHDDESDSDDDEDGDGVVAEEAVFSSNSRRPSREANCKGCIILRGNRFGRSYVQYVDTSSAAHFLLTNAYFFV